MTDTEWVSPILTGLAVDGLKALLGQLTRRVLRGLRTDVAEHLNKSIIYDTQLNQVLQRATTAVARASRSVKQSTDSLRIFLTSPEVDAIVRRIYSARLTKKENDFVSIQEEIRNEFLTSLSIHLRQSERRVSKLATQLFEALKEGCDAALAHAIQAGFLPAHEATSIARHNMLLDEVSAVKANIGRLAQLRKADISEILEFEARYREQVADQTQHIRRPFIGDATPVLMNQLYVTPDFELTSDERPGRISSEEFLRVAHRAVVLGHPGAGKSTFCQHLGSV